MDGEKEQANKKEVKAVAMNANELILIGPWPKKKRRKESFLYVNRHTFVKQTFKLYEIQLLYTCKC